MFSVPSVMRQIFTTLVSPSIEIIEPPPPDVVSVSSSIGDLQPLRHSTPNRASLPSPTSMDLEPAPEPEPRAAAAAAPPNAYASRAYTAFAAACQRNARTRRLTEAQVVAAWRRLARADRLAFHAEVLVGEETLSGAFAGDETRVRDFFRHLNNRVVV